MSLSREATLNDVVVDLAPITKREFFQSPKYSPIVGTITTSAESASVGVRLVGRGGGQQLVALAVELARGGDEEGRVGQHLAELAGRAVTVQVGLDALGDERAILAPERGLGDVVERTRLLERPAVRRLERERDGALRVLLEARPGVDVDVVLHERGRAGDDPLHALVVRVVLEPIALHVGQQRLDLRALRPPERRIVVAGGAREPVVALGVGLELLREPDELLGLPDEALLQARKARLLARPGRRGGNGEQRERESGGTCGSDARAHEVDSFVAKSCAPPRRRKLLRARLSRAFASGEWQVVSGAGSTRGSIRTILQGSIAFQTPPDAARHHALLRRALRSP